MTPQIHDEKLVEAALRLFNDWRIVPQESLEILREHIAGLTAEIARIKQNQGCAREQRSTQFCAEAVEARKDSERLDQLERMSEDGPVIIGCHGEELQHDSYRIKHNCRNGMPLYTGMSLRAAIDKAKEGK